VTASILFLMYFVLYNGHLGVIVNCLLLQINNETNVIQAEGGILLSELIEVLHENKLALSV